MGWALIAEWITAIRAILRLPIMANPFPIMPTADPYWFESTIMPTPDVAAENATEVALGGEPLGARVEWSQELQRVGRTRQLVQTEVRQQREGLLTRRYVNGQCVSVEYDRDSLRRHGEMLREQAVAVREYAESAQQIQRGVRATFDSAITTTDTIARTMAHRYAVPDPNRPPHIPSRPADWWALKEVCDQRAQAQDRALDLFTSLLTDLERAEYDRYGHVTLKDKWATWQIHPADDDSTLRAYDYECERDITGGFVSVCVIASNDPSGSTIPRADIAITLLLLFRSEGSQGLKHRLSEATWTPNLNLGQRPWCG